MSMTKAQVVALLRENKNERGITHWKKKPRGLKSFGIGLTQLRKLAKKVGRNHRLAKSLWNSDIYDAKIIGLLVDDPKHPERAHGLGRLRSDRSCSGAVHRRRS